MQRMQPTRRAGVRPRATAAAALLAALLALDPAPGAAQARQQPPPRPAAAQAVVRPAGGWLGVGVNTRVIVTAGTPREHVVIAQVEPGSPAARAGLRPGDAVLQLNGEPAVVDAFQSLPFTLAPGDTVTLLVRREDRDQRIVVVAGQRPGRYMLTWVVPADTLKRLTIELMDSARAAALATVRRHRATADTLTRQYRAYAAAVEAFGRAQVAMQDSIARLQLRLAEGDRRLRLVWPAQPDSLSVYWFHDRADSMQAEFWRHAGGLAVRAPDVQFIHVLGERGVAGAEFVELNPGLAQYFAGVTDGLLTVRVAPATPAARAQLEPGDVVVSVGGRPVQSVGELRIALLNAAGSKPQEVRLEVVRKGERRELRLLA